ncbi:hypothetical protein ACFT1B_15890 [Streptomyces griseoincarnatus]|uniref:Integral membrane protein n=1 Tax=Streptomyces variabilis TaxID=67372 RepID=A0ABQ2UB21_9ACTN|nr:MULTISPECIES: hypothetical protein [Streptomyces]GGP57357.1 hypothetical protein GCM10010265_39080 [Streptomyces griseoincarnatus]GGT81685.1 hypothetical protein GCM10010287_65090 [Streptomyces variabilis]
MYYVIAAFLGIALVFMTWKAIRLWRHPEVIDDFSTAFAFLPFGKDVRRGEVRSVLLTVITLWSAAVLFVSGLTLAEDEISTAGAYVIAGAVVVILLCLLCEASVILFNRPKFVVPPHMRADLGVIATRRARRKR